MLLKITALEQWRVQALDGEAGTIVDILFEDGSWSLLDLVVRTDGVGDARLVRVPVGHASRTPGEFGFVRVDLTRQQVHDCPLLDATQGGLRTDPQGEVQVPLHPHLHSSRDVVGYQVQASDGDAGDVDDLAVDDEVWCIRYLVVDTRRWRPGGRVLADAGIATEVHHQDRMIVVTATKDELKNAPPAA
ncbi:MAG: hypothetical protein KF891_03755 [Rhizobacter sp.]|nr:hypothetical protein [Rhizobacter sp.]